METMSKIMEQITFDGFEKEKSTDWKMNFKFAFKQKM